MPATIIDLRLVDCYLVATLSTGARVYPKDILEYEGKRYRILSLVHASRRTIPVSRSEVEVIVQEIDG